MRCTKCGTNNPSTNNFCAKCGNALAKHCAKCKQENPPTSDFCGKCGSPLASAADKSAVSSPPPSLASDVCVAPDGSSPEALEGERKAVTALFADIKGSTELEQDLDPEEARAIVDPALKLMIDAVRRYDGYVVQSTGDGIFAMFGAPLAREDHPQLALYAAIRMQEGVRRYSDRLRTEGRAPLQIRVGANTGELVVRSIETGEAKTEYNAIGHTANLASRMQTLANPGSTVIAEGTRKLVEGYFALKSLGASRVKGVAEPVEVYEVIGLGPLRTRLQRSAGRGFTKFVGRNREMDAMKLAAEQAKAGHGQIVAAIAEAGVGKSRLLFEFKAKNQPGWMVLEAFSVSHGKASAYFPVIDLLHVYFKIASEDDQRARRAKVTGNVLTLDRSLEDALPYLFALLGIVEGADPLAEMDAQTKNRRTLDAIKRILLRESLNQPLMVIFEDLHWIDQATQAFLNLLADSIGTAKILLLVNYRPEYSHQWNSKTYYTQLRLDPLGKESADEMLTALIGDGAELGPLKQLIIEKTEGNPFFMEETVQVMLDEGALVRDGAAVRLTKPFNELKIPPTVQAILAARIDRLPSDDRDLLQNLAVIGTEFRFGLIRKVVAKADEELERMLSELQLAEFIYEQPATGDLEYAFKHALTQQVAYNSMLVERRKILHQRTGTAIEDLYENRIDDRLADLARHFSRGESAEKAVEYLRRAAEHAMSRSGYAEAEPGLYEALHILGRLPSGRDRDQSEISIQTALASLYSLTKGSTSPEVERAVSRAAELCRQGQEPIERLFRVVSNLWGHLELRGEIGRLRELTDEIITLARASNNPAYIAHAHFRAGVLAYWQGDLPEALTKVRMAIQPVQTRLDKGIEFDVGEGVYARVYTSWIQQFMGYPRQAQATVDSALSVAREYDSKHILLGANDGLAYIAMLRGDPSATMEFASRILLEADELPAWSAYGTYYKGWAQASLGQYDVGIAAMQKAIGWLDGVGERMDMPRFQSSVAEALGKAGRLDEALEAIAQAMKALESRGRNLEPEVYRIQGDLLIQRDQEKAEFWLRKAIESSARHEAKSFELRASTSLARLLMRTRRRDEARAMLTEIYKWFTEGFDTADLKDAKALLDELNA